MHDHLYGVEPVETVCCCFFPLDMYVETFVLQQFRVEIKLGAHSFREFRVNLMYVNLTFEKFN